MALRPSDIANFHTLLRAAKDGNLSLVECTDKKTGEYRAVICAVNHEPKGVRMVPFGHLAESPYENYTPPSPVNEASPS